MPVLALCSIPASTSLTLCLIVLFNAVSLARPRLVSHSVLLAFAQYICDCVDRGLSACVGQCYRCAGAGWRTWPPACAHRWACSMRVTVQARSSRSAAHTASHQEAVPAPLAGAWTGPQRQRSRCPPRRMRRRCCAAPAAARPGRSTRTAGRTRSCRRSTRACTRARRRCPSRGRLRRRRS